jgi:hypothetical protein
MQPDGLFFPLNLEHCQHNYSLLEGVFCFENLNFQALRIAHQNI